MLATYTLKVIKPFDEQENTPWGILYWGEAILFENILMNYFFMLYLVLRVSSN